MDLHIKRFFRVLRLFQWRRIERIAKRDVVGYNRYCNAWCRRIRARRAGNL